MKSIRKLLIANRGEVVVRVAAACRKLGIRSVAVYSDADRTNPHVAAADEAVHIGASDARASYLDIERILAAAQRCGADGVHPGFGFLAENAAFAEACVSRGLTFVGPPVAAMRAMASKAAAKQVARAQGIPVIPGYDGADQSTERLMRAAAQVGFPLLIKASAGGGGIGMRIVHGIDAFAGELRSAQQEARTAFGDARVLIERYFDDVRHIEVQLIADRQGKVLHAFERECSIQRRRQKVIEEAPSPFVTAALRGRLADAAVKIARAVGYEGLGTIEFIVENATAGADDARFYFLEMNTRLQVEHGVTEEVTGLDLVQLQIEIAEGRPLPLEQEAIRLHGHAIECRLYAEDPANDFLPAVGTIARWRPVTGPSMRVDSGIADGTVVSTYYDPMLAKLIASGADRDQALRRMRYALAGTVLLGPVTNQNFLSRALALPAFAAGRTSTHFIADHADSLRHDGGLAHPDVAIVAAWISVSARRLAPGRRARVQASMELDGTCIEVALRLPARAEAGRPERFQAEVSGQSHDVEVLHLDRADAAAADSGLLSIDGHVRRYTWSRIREGIAVHAGELGTFVFQVRSRFARSAPADMSAGYRSAMPGRIVEVLVRAGAAVAAGARLVVMESMKLEHSTHAATAGVVKQVWVSVGQNVEAGTPLIEIEPLETP